MENNTNNTLPNAQNTAPIMVVFNPDKLVVLAGKPRKLTAKEMREYTQAGWAIKTMPFNEYKEANFKWIYDEQ
jgi:hypothetical protein